MIDVTFDTLSASKELQNAGFKAQQAEAIALVFKGSQSNLATKVDIESVKVEIRWLRWSMAATIAIMLGGFATIISLLP